MRAQDFAGSTEYLAKYFIGALGQLFAQSLTLAFPILGTLFLISIAMGLMAKAAPQMNLLSLGFPVNLLVSFFLLALIIPALMNAFSGMVDNSFSALGDMFRDISGQSHKAVGEGSNPAAAAAAAMQKTGTATTLQSTLPSVTVTTLHAAITGTIIGTTTTLVPLGGLR